MKKTNILIVFFLLLGLFYCNLLQGKTNNDSTNNKKTIVYGKVINQTAETPKVITVNACNPLEDNDKYATRLDSTGQFRAEFEMLWGHTFTISYSKNYIGVYANPGDSIYIEIDASKFHKGYKNSAVHFGGDNNKRNIEYSQISHDLGNIFNYRLFNDLTLPLDEFIRIYKTEITRVNNLISDYCKENNISQWTQNLMEDDMLYSLANYVMDYKGESSKDALEFFTHPIFDIYNDKNFATMMFPYHLLVCKSRILKDKIIAKNYKAKKFLKVEELALEKLLKLPKCLSRDFMLAQLYSKIKGNNIDKNIFYNKDVYNKVLELQNPFQPTELPKVKSGKGVFYMTKDGEVENIIDFNLEELIKEKYKGKVVYMDIWGTWCPGCIGDIASANELHKLFKDKNVVFINICMKSTQENWIKVIKTRKMSGENYFFDDDLSTIASAKLISGGYPTYILINKKGQIVNRKAPRPSSLSTAGDEIENLLKEK